MPVTHEVASSSLVVPAILREGAHTFFFYAKETAEARTYFEFERGASRVRSAFDKECNSVVKTRRHV